MLTRHQRAAYHGATSLVEPEPAPAPVPPPPLPTRRSWWSRLVRFVRVAHLRFEIDSLEGWLDACERDGIYDGEQLRYQRQHLATLRVQLIQEETAR